MPKVLVLGKALDVVNNLFKWFSVDERRKRRKLNYNDNIKRAIDLEEKHYDALLDFLKVIDGKVELEGRTDIRYYNSAVERFKKDSRKFKELT